MYWLYWFTLVYFERRYSPALLLISLTGLLSGLLITGLLCTAFSSLVTLWLAYSGLTSGLTLSLLSLVFSGVLTLVYPMAYPSPLSLLPSLLSGVPPLQIRQLAYAVTLTTSLSVYRGAHSFNSWLTMGWHWLTMDGTG